MDQNTMNQGLHSSEHKKNFLGMATIALIALVFFFVVRGIGEIKEYRHIGQSPERENVITVSGEGEVFAVPDIAMVSFTIEVERGDVTDAQETVTSRGNAIIKALKEFGVEEKDIKTTNYSSNPRYEFRRESGERRLTGFQVRHTMSVKVREADEAGRVVQMLGNRDVTNISGPNFQIDDDDELRSEARELAIDDAQEKARELARQLNVKLGQIVAFNEGGFEPFARATFALESADFGESAPAPELPRGENRITSNVTITYEIR